MKRSTLLLTPIFILIIIISSFAISAPRDLISNYDLRVYRPDQEGLIDLVFDVKVDGLEDKLSKLKSYGNFNEIKFRFYWNIQGKYKIEVIGVPKEFNNLNMSLRSTVLPIFEFFMPAKLSQSLRGYSLSGNGLNKVRAEDKSLNKGITEMYLDFDNSGRLIQLKSKMRPGTQVSNFVFNTMRQSKNRWLLEKVTKRTLIGPKAIITNTNISYQNYSGFLLPKKVVLETFINVEDEKTDKRVLKDSLVFTINNVKTNKDIARNYFKGDK